MIRFAPPSPLVSRGGEDLPAPFAPPPLWCPEEGEAFQFLSSTIPSVPIRTLQPRPAGPPLLLFLFHSIPFHSNSVPRVPPLLLDLQNPPSLAITVAVEGELPIQLPVEARAAGFRWPVVSSFDSIVSALAALGGVGLLLLSPVACNPRQGAVAGRSRLNACNPN